MKNKVVVAGHICLDITPIIPGNKYTKIEQVLSPGKLLQVQSADIHTGGAVANTGLAMKFFGADVTLMGKLGDDEFGSLVQKILAEQHVNQNMIIDPDSTTSYSIVLAPPGLDRMFLHNSGANDTFQYDDVDWYILRDAKMFHFGYPTLMKKMYSDQGQELVRIFRKLKEMNIATSLDMAAMDANSEAGRVDWEEILKRVLKYVDFFVPSYEELRFMLHRAKNDGNDDNISIDKDVRPMAEMLLEWGAKVVLIKCGAQGIFYKTADAEKMTGLTGLLGLNPDEWADKEGFEKSYHADRVLSATGAGDTSIAAFLAAVLEKRSLHTCMQLSTAAGASCVEAYDALSGLRSFEELEKKIKNGWKKNP